MARNIRQYALVKGGLTVDRTDGPRWDLALELLADGRESVMLDNVQLMRGGFGADPRLHVAVLTTEPRPTLAIAQAQVDAGRARVLPVIEGDERLRSLIERHGVVWEYCGDDGSATWLIGDVSADGVVTLRRP